MQSEIYIGKKITMKVTKSESSPTIDLLSTQVGTEMVGFRKCCQADECNSDLSDVKRYYRRHKVCELHAKAAVVLVKTIRQRFCQQCSKFHEISKFDLTKKSCRDRLADHNERRRKTHIESKYKEVKDNERIRGLVVKKHLKHFLNLNEVTAQMSPCSSASISTTATTTTTNNFYPNGANHVEINLANIAPPDYLPFSNAVNMNMMGANHPRAFF